MSRFIDECRREWDRLGVAEAVAAEMAADLQADLDEAAADGVGAEELLGDAVFDPRGFAASWAEARGVAGVPAAKPRWSSRPALIAAIVGLFAVVVAAAGVVAVAFGTRSASMAAPGQPPAGAAPAVRRPHWAFPFLGPGADHTEAVARGIVLAALVLLAIGAICLVAATIRCSPWHRSAHHPTPR